MSAWRTVLAAGLLLAAAAERAHAQKAQWTDAVYVPGRWTAGRLVPTPTANAQTDSLALVARVDFFSSPPRWRAEVRRSTNGEAFADQPDVLIGEGASVVVRTPLGATPLAQHALGRDALVRAALAVVDAGGRRVGAAAGRIVEKDAAGKVARVVFRRSVRGAAFDEALLNAGNPSASRSLLANNLRAVGDQRGASVVATAGARGVDRVTTPSGQVAVRPDSEAVRRMERYAIGAGALEDFLRRGRLGPYAARDSAGRP
jgi:hypothetical protein